MCWRAPPSLAREAAQAQNSKALELSSLSVLRDCNRVCGFAAGLRIEDGENSLPCCRREALMAAALDYPSSDEENESTAHSSVALSRAAMPKPRGMIRGALVAVNAAPEPVLVTAVSSMIL
jgi:hypothetical protein